MFELITVFWAFILIAILILVGRFIRQRINGLKALYVPSSIVAGVVALVLGPSILGAVANNLDPGTPLANGVFSEGVRAVWAQSPSIFINIVFACLFLGETIPGLRDIWRKAAPQVAFGQILAWGQYVVGLLLGLLILTPIFKMNPIVGTLIEIAFEGGHGTAAGMADTLTELGFAEGPDLALGLATVGILSGVISGTWLINWGRNQHKIQVSFLETSEAAGGSEEDHEFDHPTETPEVKVARAQLIRELLIDPLSLNFAFVGLAVVFGWFILEGLKLIEALTWGTMGLKLISYVPLFPMTLIGGLLVQLLLVRLNRPHLISRVLITRIGGIGLDVTIVTALATISLTAIGSNLLPFAILSVAGISWNIWAFLYLGPRLLPSYWFERGIGDMGQSMGVTSTGLLLIRMIDPNNRSGALESFAYKQLFFEPIVGGGLFTAAAPVLVHRFGAVAILILTTIILVAWLAFGFTNFKRITQFQSSEQVNT